MSQTALRELLRRHAFNSTPSEAELADLHVPFDTITGELRYEQLLSESLRRGERVALIGPSGSGKSSVTSHVLDGFVHDLAPIRVRVGLEPDAVSTEPIAFIRHLVHTVATYIDQPPPDVHAPGIIAGRADRRRAHAHARATRPTVATRRPTKVSVGVGAPWLQGQLAVELTGVIETTGPSGQDVLAQAQQILAVIAAWDLRPVLVLDDTDHWLVRPGLPAPDRLIAGFFGRIVRLIAERLPDAAAVIAVHETYRRDPSFADAAGFLESQIELPAIPSPPGLGPILRRRAERALRSAGGTDLDAIISVEAIDHLHRHYLVAGRSLRNQLRLVHGALAHACDAGSAVIEPTHLDQAISE